MTERTNIWSFGGGVQSQGMLALMLKGRLPLPKHVVMADTGRERSLVWDYIEEVSRPALKTLGLELEIISHEDFAYVDLFSHKGKLLLPYYWRDSKDKVRMSGAFCSQEWKRYPVMRYLRSIGYGPSKPVSMWIGISIDEVERIRKSRVKWLKNAYPLCDRDITRDTLYRAVIDTGWPTPPKSSCYMCPYRDNHGWIELQGDGNSDFETAKNLEKALGPNVFFHRKAKPLEDAVEESKTENNEETEKTCNTGMCFV